VDICIACVKKQTKNEERENICLLPYPPPPLCSDFFGRRSIDFLGVWCLSPSTPCPASVFHLRPSSLSLISLQPRLLLSGAFLSIFLALGRPSLVSSTQRVRLASPSSNRAVSAHPCSSLLVPISLSSVRARSLPSQRSSPLHPWSSRPSSLPLPWRAPCFPKPCAPSCCRIHGAQPSPSSMVVVLCFRCSTSTPSGRALTPSSSHERRHLISLFLPQLHRTVKFPCARRAPYTCCSSNSGVNAPCSCCLECSSISPPWPLSFDDPNRVLVCVESQQSNWVSGRVIASCIACVVLDVMAELEIVSVLMAFELD
jgi:hypothetical protein